MTNADDSTETESDDRSVEEAAAEMHRWRSGERIFGNEFVVRRHLGAGGTGDVWLVEMDPHERPAMREVVSGVRYAAKRLRIPSREKRPDMLNELLTCLDLPTHPNILPFKFWRTLEDDVVIFSEYVEAGSLKDRWGGRALELTVALDYLIQIAFALKCMHESGFVHGDIKAGNVMLRAGGLVQVSDLGTGFEHRVGANEQAALWSLSRSRGMTRLYASPEQIAGQQVGPKTDIWSWAALGLELLYGAQVFSGATDARQALDGARNLPVGHDQASRRIREDVLAPCLAHALVERPGEIGLLAERLSAVYLTITGQRYPRSEPPFASLSKSGDAAAQREPIWYEARRFVLDASDAVSREYERAVQANDPQAAAIDEIILQMSADVVAIAPGIGRTVGAQLVHCSLMLRDAIEAYRRLIALGTKPLQRELADALAFEAKLCGMQGDLAGQLKALEEAARLLGTDATVGSDADDISAPLWTRRGEACALSDHNRTDEAIALLEMVQLDARGALDATMRAPEIRDSLVRLVATSCTDIGIALQREHKYDDALLWFAEARKALSGYVMSFTPVELTAWIDTQEANALDSLGRVDDALALYRRAIASYDASTNLTAAGHLQRSSSLLNMVLVLNKVELFEEADLAAAEVVAFRRRLLDGTWRTRHDLAIARSVQVQALLGIGKYDNAVEAAQEAHDIWQELVEREGHVELGSYVYRAMLRLADAEVARDEAI